MRVWHLHAVALAVGAIGWLLLEFGTTIAAIEIGAFVAQFGISMFLLLIVYTLGMVHGAENERSK